MSNVSPTYTIVIMPMRSTTGRRTHRAASHGMDIRWVQRSCDTLDSSSAARGDHLDSSVPSMSAKSRASPQMRPGGHDNVDAALAGAAHGIGGRRRDLILRIERGSV